MGSKADEIVDVVLGDLFGRQGFDAFWGEIQADVQVEIRETLIAKVDRLIG
jgi:hypothetical protein